MYRILCLPLLLNAVATVGCSSSTPGTGCASNDECQSGEICDQSTCKQVCSADTECDSGHVCDASLCVPGSRPEPIITAIDGDGTETDCSDGNVPHCMAHGVMLEGTNLTGAAFTLTPQGGTAIDLTVRDGGTDTAVTVNMPDVGEGLYTLTATNAAGSGIVDLQLLQGPPGPAMTPEEIVAEINKSSVKILSSILYVDIGSQDVAAGDHGHSQYLTGIAPGDVTTTEILDGTIADADIDATGISSRSKLPAALAYEDEANSFSQDQHITENLTVDKTITADAVVANNLWIKIHQSELSNVGSTTVTGLNGDAYNMFKVFFIGTLAAGNLDREIYVRPNGVATGYRAWACHDGESGWCGYHTEGFWPGRNGWSEDATFTFEETFTTRTGAKRLAWGHASFSMSPSNRGLYWPRSHAVWNDTNTVITSLWVGPTAGTISGRLIIYAMP